MKIEDATAVKISTKIFNWLPFDTLLFSQSSYQYHKKWHILLKDFSIDASSGLTPGGLRGGAAVLHYKQGRAIADLFWMMRLRSQITLESYLQEVAALNAQATLTYTFSADPHQGRRCHISSAVASCAAPGLRQTLTALVSTGLL